MRLKLFSADFWVIESGIEALTENIPIENVAALLSPTVLENCPQCYPLTVRKKYFAWMIK